MSERDVMLPERLRNISKTDRRISDLRFEDVGLELEPKPVPKLGVCTLTTALKLAILISASQMKLERSL